MLSLGKQSIRTLLDLIVRSSVFLLHGSYWGRRRGKPIIWEKEWLSLRPIDKKDENNNDPDEESHSAFDTISLRLFSGSSEKPFLWCRREENSTSIGWTDRNQYLFEKNFSNGEERLAFIRYSKGNCWLITNDRDQQRWMRRTNFSRANLFSLHFFSNSLTSKTSMFLDQSILWWSDRSRRCPPFLPFSFFLEGVLFRPSFSFYLFKVPIYICFLDLYCPF